MGHIDDLRASCKKYMQFKCCFIVCCVLVIAVFAAYIGPRVLPFVPFSLLRNPRSSLDLILVLTRISQDYYNSIA